MSLPSIVAPDPVGAGRSTVARCDQVAPAHRVQFYDQESFLQDVVADFLGEGLTRGESAVVIATEAHRIAFGQRLAERGHDVGQARRAGQLTLLDASATLAGFMAEGEPDGRRFRGAVEPVFTAIRERRPGRAIRAYGEMVDLLWRDGSHQAAVRLEELWNELGRRQAFDLLCAYRMGNFHDQAHTDGFDQICRAHSHVTPTESCGRISGPDSLLRQVSLLEHRARALESEILHRKQLEASLRAALAEQERMAEALRVSEQQLRAHNEDLTRAVCFSESFASLLGHDLRNPLSGITTTASLLVRRADSDRILVPSQRILSSGRRMARMIDQLLDFAHLRAGKGLPLDPGPVDLGAVCRLALEELATERGNGAATELAASPGLTAVGDLVGTWDRDRLCQLVSNVVGNALTHGRPGAPVQISLDGTDVGSVSMEVHNAGAIPDSVLRVIFEPFRGGPDCKPGRSSGLGLGLYISRQIALAHQGRIEVSSSGGTGTRFMLRLPRLIGPPSAPLIS